MGTATSQIQGVLPFLSKCITEDNLPTLLSSEIQSLTYEEFCQLIQELNQLSSRTYNSDGKQLIFAVKKGTYSTVFWKGTILIACVKLDTTTKKIESHRLLNLSQFLKVFKTFKCQLSAAEHSKNVTPKDLTMSTLFDSIEYFSEPNSLERQTECCICLERKQEVILPCAHSYCLQCLEEWGEAHDTCPICREKFEGSDDSWVLSEVPNAEEICEEIKESLKELIEEKSSSTSSEY